MLGEGEEEGEGGRKEGKGVWEQRWSGKEVKVGERQGRGIYKRRGGREGGEKPVGGEVTAAAGRAGRACAWAW